MFRNGLKFFSQALIPAILALGISNAFADPTLVTDPSYKDWSGIYVGAEVGKTINRVNFNYDNLNYFNSNGILLLGNNFNLDSSGAVKGGIVGCNFEIESFVYGIEASALSLNFNTTKGSPFFSTDLYSSSLKWVNMVKGRLGYDYARWLPFVSFGWAGGNTGLTLYDPLAHVQASSNFFSNGWTAGLGLEYKLSDHFSIGATYNYIQLDNRNKNVLCSNCGVGIGAGTPVIDAHYKINSFLANVNYFF